MSKEIECENMKRCDCAPGILTNEKLRYDNMVVVELPENSERRRRILEGIGSTVSIDPCIVDEIKHLWSLGIVTLGCCCGHNELQSMVNVSDENIQQMLDLGYVQNHIDPTRRDTFRLKTAG